jgi:hypothetical protein
MPQIAADPPSPPVIACYRLFSKPGIQEFQRLGPDLLLLRTRDVRERFANGPSGKARGRRQFIQITCKLQIAPVYTSHHTQGYVGRHR